MNEEIKFYFQFKPNIRQVQGQPVILKDVIELSGPVEATNDILNTIVVPSKNKDAVVITAMDVIRIIQSFFPNSQIYLVGEGKTLIETLTAKSASASNFLLGLKYVLVLFYHLLGRDWL